MIYGASAGWTSSNYDFDRDYKRLGLAALYTDTNPDLRHFKAAGGKLLVYQGGTDTTEMPTAIVDYYETVEKVMGGSKPTQDFFRLFVIPGMNHCGGGVGAYSIDYLTYMENWVERDQAPDEMIGARVSDSYLLSLPLPEGLPADASRERRIAAATRKLQFPLDPKIPLSLPPALCIPIRNSPGTHRAIPTRPPVFIRRSHSEWIRPEWEQSAARWVAVGESDVPRDGSSIMLSWPVDFVTTAEIPNYPILHCDSW